MAECSFHEHQLPPLSSVRPLSPSPKDPTHIHRDLNDVLQVYVQHYHSSGEKHMHVWNKTVCPKAYLSQM